MSVEGDGFSCVLSLILCLGEAPTVLGLLLGSGLAVVDRRGMPTNELLITGATSSLLCRFVVDECSSVEPARCKEVLVTGSPPPLVR